MDLFWKNTLKSAFTFICIIGVVCMIMYWAYKYKIEDRDIGVVDYVSLQESENIHFPVLTICLVNPFKENKLFAATNGTVTTEMYLEYMKGNLWNENIAKLDYQSLSMNLNDYFDGAEEQWKNSSQFRDSQLSFRHEELLSGFLQDRFMKCFAIDSDISTHRYIQTVILHYNRTKIMSDWSNFTEGNNLTTPGFKWEFFRRAHYPGQFLLAEEPILSSAIKQDADISKAKPISSFDAWISNVEVLKRRNSRQRRCSEGGNAYDHTILMSHVANFECQPPYFNINTSFPSCKTSKKIKEAKFSFFTPKSMDYPKDCLQMPRMLMEGWEHQLPGWEEDWQIYIQYPEDIKMIIQDKEIDIHGLIGNCGGYLGLFLGTDFNF